MKRNTNQRDAGRITKGTMRRAEPARFDHEEIQSWRRSTEAATQQQKPMRFHNALLISVICFLIILLVECRPSDSQSAGQSKYTFMPTWRHQQQHQYQSRLVQAPPPPPPPQAQQHQLNSQALAQGDRCKIGAPLQWRPYLDASSKAYLAPVVALATLKHFNLTPIQLAGSASSRASSRESVLFHAQNVNNVGVLIRATFQVQGVLRRTRLVDLQAGRTIELLYKVDASLSTTSAIFALANSEQSSAAASKHQNQTSQPKTHQEPPSGSSFARFYPQQYIQPLLDVDQCALELSENELVKRGGRLFKANQDYVLFLEQTLRRRAINKHQAYAHQPQAVGGNEPLAWHPFAAHEPVTNHTSRAIKKSLCRNCGKYRGKGALIVNGWRRSLAPILEWQDFSTGR